MEHIYDIKETLKNYCRINTELSLEGGPTHNGEKYLQKVKTEKNILSYFGLPLTSKYIKLIWNTFNLTNNLNDNITLMLDELQRKSREYQSSKNANISDKLLHALENKREAFDLFPEIDIDLNLYTLFVYNEMFLAKHHAVDIIIRELQKASAKECLSNIYQLSLLSKKYENSDYYSFLTQKGLFFVNDFVNWCKLRDNQKYNSTYDLSTKNEDAIQSLSLAFRLFLHYKQKGYSNEKAKKHSGLTNERVFKIVQYVYTHT